MHNELTRNPFHFLLLLFIVSLIYVVTMVMGSNIYIDTQYIYDLLEKNKVVITFALDEKNEYVEISEELKQYLQASPHIKQTQTINSYSASLKNGNVTAASIPFSMSAVTIFIGNIESFDMISTNPSMPGGNAYVTIDKIYAGNPAYIWKGKKIHVIMTDEKLLNNVPRQGQKYLFCTDIQSIDADFNMESPIVIQDSLKGIAVHFPQRSLFSDYYLLPCQDQYKYVEEVLFKYQLDTYINSTKKYDSMVTIRSISDMTDLKQYMNNSLIITQGDLINQYDSNKRICVISDILANINGWKIGDKLIISIASDTFDVYGYPSGVPCNNDFTNIDYVNDEIFQISGIYTWDKKYTNSDRMRFSNNDILIPEGMILYETEPICNSFTYSFTVSEDQLDGFFQYDLPVIESYGYKVELTRNKLTDYKSTMDSLISNMKRNITICLVMFFPILVGLYRILDHLFTYNYVLSSLLGADEKQKNGYIYQIYILAMIIGLFIASVCGTVLVLYCMERITTIQGSYSSGAFIILNCILLLAVSLLLLALIYIYICSLKKISLIQKLGDHR